MVPTAVKCGFRPFDIFLVDKNGVLWLQSAASLDDAKSYIEQVGSRTGGEFLVLDQEPDIKLKIEVKNRESSTRPDPVSDGSTAIA